MYYDYQDYYYYNPNDRSVELSKCSCTHNTLCRPCEREQN